MWISRQFSETGKASPELQTGKVTLNSGGELEAVSSGVERNIGIYAPYGYAFSLPQGCELLLSQSSGEQAAIGVSMSSHDLKTGEIRITSASGGYIYLKDDGSVVINGLEINRWGEIVE